MKLNSSFGWEISGDGINVFALTKNSRLPLSELSSTERLTAGRALARIEAAISNGEEGYRRLEDGTGYWLSKSALQSLDSDQAQSINLPPDCPHSLWVKLTGPFTSSNSRAVIAWHDISGAKASVKETSGILYQGSKSYRIPLNLAAIQSACESFNASANDLDERLAATSILKGALSAASGESVGADAQLQAMRFRHASSLSIDIFVAKDGVQFDPVFFSKEVVDQATESGETVKEAESLLTPELHRRMGIIFREANRAKPTYVLDRGEYIFIDPSIRPALEVIKEQQKGTPEERSRFARTPQAYFRERYLSEGYAEEQVDTVVGQCFVETDSFSERVIEVGLWRPPVLPFIKRAPNSWFPESFGLKIGTKNVVIPEDQIKPLAESVASAIAKGLVDVAISGTSDSVPATKDTLDALNAMLTVFLKIPPVNLDSDADSSEEKPIAPEPANGSKDKSILVVQDNFVDELFVAQFVSRTKFVDFEVPDQVRTQLKKHQIEGVTWLQKTWSLGYPGVLLADDMGLGKTLQALSFLCWLKSKRDELQLPVKPALVVAPISLLGNWESEAQLHLSQGGLGRMTKLYGHSIRDYKLESQSRPDVVEGRATLDVSALRNSDWILTTYETMRDYNLSLGVIGFSVIAFDEMQKIKNPQSMMTNAAQALQAEYMIGLTGTPIENSLADIWTIFDTLMPGALGLGNLRAFLNHYKLDNPDALKELKVRLQDGSEQKPAPMLRRMKTDVAKDLPRKLEIPIERNMPEAQALAYVKAIKGATSAQGKRSRLDAFHRIRGISLHPRFAGDKSSSDVDQYIGESARLISCFELLDEIYQRKEKVLVFVESIAMQEWMSFALKERYRLSKSPGRIFGETSAEKRTAIVDGFQSASKGAFDVLILSPKAAGVGLTLTAATNVIHLTRWWNPAVEDQCTDRAYRIGQTADVNVYYLQAIHPLYGKGSFDCILNELLIRKRSLSKGMLMPVETGDELNEIFTLLAAGPAP